MDILCIGDIVGKAGRSALTELVPVLKKEYALDLVVANAENAAGGSGLTPRIAGQLFRAGCDVLTLGDHVWDRPELLEDEVFLKGENIVRPANFPDGTPGKGWCLVDLPGGKKVGVINLLGRVFMRYNVDCPFRSLEKIVAEVRKETNMIIVDFHAETTSEKTAMGIFSDGKVSAVLGTHTHIQTADEKILPQGTAYLTDLGMTGPYDSVIGQKKEKIIKRFLLSMPMRFEVAQEDIWLMGAVVTVNEATGKAEKIIRIQKKALQQKVEDD